jgi:starch-binding outer membrane protein, SusD/RagB family
MKKTVLTSFLLLCLLGCGEEFLDVKDTTTISADAFPINLTNLNLQLNTVYAKLHSNGLYGDSYLQKDIYCLDHTSDQAYTAFAFWNDIHQNNAQPAHPFLFDLWKDTYSGVQACNTLLGDIDNYRQKYLKAGEEDALRKMEGQTRLFRGHYLSILETVFGETFIVNGQGGDRKGIPLITQTARSLNETYLPRASVRQVWDTIIADFKRAEVLLADVKSWDGANLGRVTVWTAKSLLGKAYLYTEDWAKAKTSFEEVILNSGKTLMPFAQYKDMFLGQYENNQESIFEINLEYDPNGWGLYAGPVASQVAALYFAPSYMSDNGKPTNAGFSNTEPLYTFVNNPDFNANKPEGYDKSTGQWNLKTTIDPAYVAKSRTLRETGAVDPRLWVGALQPYVDSMTADGVRRPIVKYIDSPDNSYGFSLRKYNDLRRTEYASNAKSGSNFYVVRLADVYLMYAESLIRSGGDQALALEYINKVKRRAYNLPVDAPSVVDYKTLSDKTKAGDPLLSNNPLKYERWAELFGEGHWWFDVCRWKIGAQEAAYYVQVKSGPIQWSDVRSYAQPIPITEINSNPKLQGQQNPGY